MADKIGKRPRVIRDIVRDDKGQIARIIQYEEDP